MYKVSADLKNKFDSKPAYHKNYFKKKIMAMNLQIFAMKEFIS